MPDTSYLIEHGKKISGIAGGFGTLILAVFVAFGNFRAGTQHNTDEVQQLRADVNQLKTQVANDMATRRELDDVKATVNRIEDKVDKELEYHRGH